MPYNYTLRLVYHKTAAGHDGPNLAHTLSKDSIVPYSQRCQGYCPTFPAVSGILPHISSGVRDTAPYFQRCQGYCPMFPAVSGILSHVPSGVRDTVPCSQRCQGYCPIFPARSQDNSIITNTDKCLW